MKVKPAELTELVELLARMLTNSPPAKNARQQEAGDRSTPSEGTSNGRERLNVQGSGSNGPDRGASPKSSVGGGWTAWGEPRE